MSLSAQAFARNEAAEAGHRRMTRLQCMNHYELRTLLAGDPAEAAVWVTSAAEYGLPAAQLRLGRMLLEGHGLPKNPNLALFWFRRAAEQSDAEAMNMVARCFENGWGVPPDLNTASHWYQRSACRGHDWGQYNFGNMLFDGRGVALNQPLAVYWYWCAARQGHARAMNLAGRCSEEGWGCPRDCAEAFDWYRRSAESGYFRGQFNYATALAERGRLQEAAEWFYQAALAGTAEIRRDIAKALAAIRHPLIEDVALRLTRLPSDVALVGR